MRFSRRQNALLAVLILTAASVGGYYVYQNYLDAQERQRMAQQRAQFQALHALQAKADADRRARLAAENTRPIADKPMRDAVPAGYPRQISQWKATEKSTYKKLLAAGQFDVLVVPFQVQEYALDRATRSLMTAELSLAISAEQKLRLPDPYVVTRALGEGERRLDHTEVYALADKIGAQKIIWTYVGHDRNFHMALSIQVQQRGASGVFDPQAIPAAKNFEQIAFTDDNPPFEAFQTILPEVLKVIGVDGTAWAAARSQSSFGRAPLPVAPLAMISEKPEPAHDALYFELLAALTPHAAERTKQYFAEKSMLALLGMSPDSPDYHVLKARAFMLLGLRPAALRVLGEPRTPEEKELYAMLNGNQPDVETYGAQIKSGVPQVIAKLDANYLKVAYTNINKEQSLAVAASLKLPGQVWPFLAGRAFADGDMWAQFDNIYLKQLLDHEFPIKDFTAESIVRGAASLRDAEKLQVTADLSVINHIRKLQEVESATWCCTAPITHPSRMDYLTLIETIGNDDLMRRADFLTQIQGAPERTLAYLDQIESVYKGFPEFSLARAQAEVARANAVEGLQKEGLLTSAYKNFFDVMYWEQGQSFLSADAFNEVGGTGRQDYGRLPDNYYASDYPFRTYYPNWEHGGQPAFMVANAEAALKNSISDLGPVEFLAWHYGTSNQNDRRDALYKSIEGRFQGNPKIYEMRATNSLEMGDTQSAQQYYRDSIKAQPAGWTAYRALGSLLVSDGELRAADKLFLSYPGFKPGAKENPVGISNNAYEAGSKFFWLGEFSLMKPFYQLASRLETGAASGLTARQRLLTLSGDYRGAIACALELSQHYGQSYAYRDYIEMLHALGDSKDAWAAFNMVMPQLNEPYVWESALVGQRIEGKSEAEIAEWVKQMVAQNVGTQGSHAAKYMLRTGVTDRTPSKNFATALAAVEQPVWKVSYPQGSPGMVVRVSANGNMQEVLGPKAPEGSVLPIGVFAASKKVVIKSATVYFAEAYRAIRTGDFSSARANLQEAADLYDLSLNEFGYMLPYYAFASVKVGDTAAVEKYLAGFTPKNRGFDYQLAQAVLAGMNNKKPEALAFLRRALYIRPFVEERAALPEYEYAEICKWLFGATNDSTYRNMALDWAKKNQKFQPWFAWPYAMEAVLSSNKADRRRAIAMTHYLDPNSEMLSTLPEAERKAAIREYANKNPFLVKGNSTIQSQI